MNLPVPTFRAGQPRAPARHAFTLLELLAVLVLLAALASIGLVSLARADQSASLRAAAAAFAATDAKARRLALQHGSATLLVDPHPHAPVAAATSAEARHGSLALARRRGVDVQAFILDGARSQPIRFIRYDSTAATRDHTLVFSSPTESLTLLLNGLSGETTIFPRPQTRPGGRP